MAKLFRLAQKRDRRSINTLKNADGTFSEPGTDTIRILTNTHFPAAHPGKAQSSYDSSNKISVADLETRYEDWINPLFVRAVMRKFKPNKAAGPDELKPMVFKYLPNNAITILTLIYKACIALHHTPEK